MDRRIKRLSALCLAAVMLLTACGSDGDRDTGSGDEHTVSIGEEVQQMKAADDIFSVNYDPDASMNPITAVSAANMQFWSLMYDSVFVVESDFSVSSEVVTKYESSDYKWWVFYVDTGITFHDGSSLSASDVVYSIMRARQYEYYSNRLSCIYGISAMGDDCFAISLEEANSQLPALLNIPVIKSGSISESAPLGTGPYMLDETGTKLVKYEGYRHASTLPVDTVYLKDYMDTADKISAYEASLIDVVTNDPTGMYNLGYGSSNETRYYDTTNMHFIGFNFNSRYFSSSVARYAVASAVDRQSMVSEYMGNAGVASVLPVNPVSSLYDASLAEKYSYDLDRSQILFQNFGVKDYDDDGVLEIMITGIVVEIDIDFIVNNDSTVKLEAARMLTEELCSIGIKTTLRELSWDDYIKALEDGDYDMYYGEVAMTPDWNLSYMFKPYTVARDAKDTDKGMNYANCFDEQYTTLYAAYLAAGQENRAAAYSELCEYVMSQAAIVPICFERREILTHRGVASGIQATQYDIFNKFYEWTIELK